MRTLLRAASTLGIRWPRLSLGLVLALVVLGLGFTFLGPLGISTSRQALVSDEVPAQARMNDFLERFGRRDPVLFVVSGGAASERQAVVESLLPKLNALPELSGRILGQLDLSRIAEILGLNHPPLLAGLRDVAKDHRTVGLTGIAEALQERIYGGLDGEETGGDVGEIGMLAPLLDAVGRALEGGSALDTFLGLARDEGLGSQATLDADGYLTAQDGRVHLVITFPELQSDEGSEVAPLIGRMRAARDAALQQAARPGVRADLTGQPALAADELQMLSTSIPITSVLTVVGIFLLLLFAFRALRFTILALIPLGAGVAITLGFVQLAYGELNLVTSSFMPVLMGLGIDIGVHLLFRYGEARRDGEACQEATRTSLLQSGPGVATGAATTALAFLTVATTEFTAFGQMGVITAVGLVAMLVCGFLLTPPLLRVGLRKRQGRADPPISPEFPGARLALVLVRRFPKSVLLASTALTVFAVTAYLPSGPSFDSNYWEFLPAETESRLGLEQLAGDPTTGPFVAHLTASSLSEARTLAAELAKSPHIGTVHSASDLFPPPTPQHMAAIRAGVAGLDAAAVAELHGPKTPTQTKDLDAALVGLQDAFDELVFGLNKGKRDTSGAKAVIAAIGRLRAKVAALDAAGKARLASLEGDLGDVARRALQAGMRVAERGHVTSAELPPFFRTRYTSQDGSLLAVYAYPSKSIFDPIYAEAFTDAVLAVQPGASGHALDVHRHERLVVDGFVRAALYALALIFVLLMVIFRRPTETLLAMIPVVIAFVWLVGLMKPLGLPFNMANMVVLPLILGIGVDAGAHIIHRYRETSHGGGPASLDEMVGGTGAAVLVSFLTTMVGFAALIAGDYLAMKTLGATLVLSMALCTFSSVFVLPAVLIVMKRAA